MNAGRVLRTIIIVAVGVRVASALYQGAAIEPLPGVTDQISYHELALRVLDGHGFSFGTGWWPATPAEQPTAHWSFLYVLFLSAIYAVFGPEPLAARLVQAVLVGVLQPWLTARIGTRLFDARVGAVGAALSAVYGYFVFYGGALVTESLFIVALLWVIDRATALAYQDEEATAWLPWITLGLAMACAALLRQSFLLVLPVIVIWLVWELVLRRRGSVRAMRVAPLATRMAVVMAVLAACVLPWTVRNYRAFGEVVVLNTNAGFVFFWANHPVHGDEFIPILGNGPVNYGSILPEGLYGLGLNEAQLDRALMKEGLAFVAADPWRYARLSLSRTQEFFKFWPSSKSSLASNVARMLSFGLLAPFLLLGTALALAQRRRGPSGIWLLLAIAAVHSLAHVLTWTLVRYRVPVDAIAIPLAAYAAVFTYEQLAGRIVAPRAVARAGR